MVPKPPDWGAHIDVTGYLFLNESKLRTEGYTPPQDLADFLAAGPPPVYIGVSSPSAAAALAACRAVRLRLRCWVHARLLTPRWLLALVSSLLGMLHAGLYDCLSVHAKVESFLKLTARPPLV